MAEAATLDELSFGHYLALSSVSDLLERQLRQVWVELSDEPPVTIVQALTAIVPGIGDTFGEIVAALSLDFYESAREIADPPQRFTPKAPDLPEVGRYESLVRGTVGPLFGDVPDLGTAESKLVGGLQKIVSNVSRDAITQNTAADPQAKGWKRITRASGGCPMCRALADKGAIYKEATATFATHDHCKCSAAPTWDNSREASVIQYVASTRRRTDQDRDRLRRYLKREYPAEPATT